MSKLAIKGNDSGTATFTIEAPATSTDRTLTLPDSAGEVVVASGGALPALDGSALTGLAGGTVKQIQGATQPVAGSVQLSQSWGDLSGLSVSITPESASNKILLVAMVSISYNNNGSLRFTKNGTPIGVGNAAGSRQQTTTQDANVATNGITYTLIHLDDPSTTSAITYKVQAWAYDFYGLNYAYSNNQDVNYRFRAISNIYAIEVE